MLLDLKEVYEKEKELIGKEVTLQGWIINHRKQKGFGFIDFNDGTCFKNLQVVYDDKLDSFSDIQKLKIGSSITIKGTIVSSPKEGQSIEMNLSSLTLEGDCPDDYPIQPKRHTREFLREVAHLRPRTNLFNAVFRVRSIASYAIHKYFQERGLFSRTSYYC